MGRTNDMLATHPKSPAKALTQLVECIDACLEAAQATTSCADACLSSDDVASLASCLRACLDCADIADMTARFLSRQTEIDWYLAISVLDTCIHACEICSDECTAQADRYAHCRVCAEACQRCADSCRRLMGELPQPSDIF
jgi:hypothetical protein